MSEKANNYFGVSSKEEAVKELRAPLWRGRLNELAEAIENGLDWQDAMNSAYSYVSEGCGISG